MESTLSVLGVSINVASFTGEPQLGLEEYKDVICRVDRKPRLDYYFEFVYMERITAISFLHFDVRCRGSKGAPELMSKGN